MPSWNNYGSIESIGPQLWQAADGTTSLDPNGTSRGGVGQLLSGLTIGATYDLSFFLSKNSVVSTASLDVLWLSADPGSNFFTATGTGPIYAFNAPNTTSNMMWSQRTGTLTATSDSMLLGPFLRDSRPPQTCPCPNPTFASHFIGTALPPPRPGRDPPVPQEN